MLIDIAYAVTYLHDRTEPVVHGNLKTTNVLLDQHMRCKLSGFRFGHIQTSPSKEQQQQQQSEMNTSRNSNNPRSSKGRVSIISSPAHRDSKRKASTLTNRARMGSYRSQSTEPLAAFKTSDNNVNSGNNPSNNNNNNNIIPLQINNTTVNNHPNPDNGTSRRRRSSVLNGSVNFDMFQGGDGSTINKTQPQGGSSIQMGKKTEEQKRADLSDIKTVGSLMWKAPELFTIDTLNAFFEHSVAGVGGTANRKPNGLKHDESSRSSASDNNVASDPSLQTSQQESARGPSPLDDLLTNVSPTEPTAKSDVYSFAIIMYEVLSQQLPYSNIAPRSLPYLIRVKNFRPNTAHNFFTILLQELDEILPSQLEESQDSLNSKDEKEVQVGIMKRLILDYLIELMSNCWKPNPKDRPTFAEIVKELSLINCIIQFQVLEWDTILSNVDVTRPPTLEELLEGIAPSKKDETRGKKRRGKHHRNHHHHSTTAEVASTPLQNNDRQDNEEDESFIECKQRFNEHVDILRQMDINKIIGQNQLYSGAANPIVRIPGSMESDIQVLRPPGHDVPKPCNWLIPETDLIFEQILGEGSKSVFLGSYLGTKVVVKRLFLQQNSGLNRLKTIKGKVFQDTSVSSLKPVEASLSNNPNEGMNENIMGGLTTSSISLSNLGKSTKTLAISKKSTEDDSEVVAVLKRFMREQHVLLQLRHPNLVTYIGCSLSIKSHCLMLVMEHLHRGSLSENYTKSVPPFRTLIDHLHFVFKVAIDVARGMSYLHTRSPPILHRDLTASNIILDSDFRCKISGFHNSVQMKANVNKEAKSWEKQMEWDEMKILWMAPEALNSLQYTMATDVYSYGIICWAALHWKRPDRQILEDTFLEDVGNKTTFNPQRRRGSMELGVDEAELRFGSQLGLDEDEHERQANADIIHLLVKLFKECVKSDPNERPSFQRILSALEHVLAAVPTFGESLSLSNGGQSGDGYAKKRKVQFDNDDSIEDATPTSESGN
eukprot:TRINITY_DN2135_c0_g3_i1.p1 TRINITY_DN2135_c0_g3~~TRINITY_DN2135_c0_g3_i1.p1  ORF type:complete len:997 (-),score=307.08 TRINITY_DN2135_c0_g3_i1:76-3066(-)